MKVKLICLLIASLFFCITIPSTLANDYCIRQNGINIAQSSGYFILGHMTHIDPKSSLIFEVVSFIIIIGNGDIIRLNQEEMIEIHDPIFSRL